MRTCETIGYTDQGDRIKVEVLRADEPDETGRVYSLVVREPGTDRPILTADLTQTIGRMMEAEIRDRSRAYLLACERAGCQPCWSPPAGGAGDPEPDVRMYARLKSELIAELRAELKGQVRCDINTDDDYSR